MEKKSVTSGKSLAVLNYEEVKAGDVVLVSAMFAGSVSRDGVLRLAIEHEGNAAGEFTGQHEELIGNFSGIFNTALGWIPTVTGTFVVKQGGTLIFKATATQVQGEVFPSEITLAAGKAHK